MASSNANSRAAIAYCVVSLNMRSEQSILTATQQFVGASVSIWVTVNQLVCGRRGISAGLVGEAKRDHSSDGWHSFGWSWERAGLHVCAKIVMTHRAREDEPRNKLHSSGV
jgi:hypothetical protein